MTYGTNSTNGGLLVVKGNYVKRINVFTFSKYFFASSVLSRRMNSLLQGELKYTYSNAYRFFRQYVLASRAKYKYQQTF